MQFRHAVAPDSEYTALEQFVHAAEPFVDLKVPSRHATHGDPPGPVYPGLQTHASLAVLCAGEFWLARQATQLWPCTAYVFAGQTHTLAPSNEDIPAGH